MSWEALALAVQLITFRIHRPAAVASLTAGRAGVILHTWCNLETDFVQVLADTDERAASVMKAIQRRFGPDVAFNNRSSGTRRSTLIKCPANRFTSVSVTVERHGGVVQAPIISKDGWDTFKIILFEEKKASACLAALQKLGDFQLVAKRPLKQFGATKFFVPSAELLEGLTRRQADAIVAAVDNGYYDQPRATTLARLAGELGLGRASLEEHLRKAENKMMKALAPFVAVKAGAMEPPRPRGKPFAGNSRRNGQGDSKPATARKRPKPSA